MVKILTAGPPAPLEFSISCFRPPGLSLDPLTPPPKLTTDNSRSLASRPRSVYGQHLEHLECTVQSVAASPGSLRIRPINQMMSQSDAHDAHRSMAGAPTKSSLARSVTTFLRMLDQVRFIIFILTPGFT